MVHILVLIYLACISLGLPDALLGSAWPLISAEFQVPLSYMGLISLIISGCTAVSSFFTDRLTSCLGTGRVAAISVALTAVALFGFSTCDRYWLLAVWAIPYGLGAGSIDASLNNYVACHYESRFMSWFHCMWGVGASIGPYIMGAVLAGGQVWNIGYLYIGIFQVFVSVVLFISIPKWKPIVGEKGEAYTLLPLGQMLKIPGVKEVLMIFTLYSILEAVTGHWATSYLTFCLGMEKARAASMAAMFYLGITAGRGISGFLTYRLNDKQMAYIGMGAILAGILTMLLCKNAVVTTVALVVAGFGCAPIFPCIVHATPDWFGTERSLSIMGVQMASFYVGTCIFPMAFGFFAEWVGIRCLPAVILLTLAIMFLLHQRLYRLTVSK